MGADFVHLHLHSEFSLRDSTIRIKALIKRCVELGQPAVALTDDSNLFALVKFYRAAMAAGIKPIAGADVWVAEPGQVPGRFTLLCQDHAGYLNLARLVSRAYREGHQGERVVVEAAWLDAMNEGLIALAGRDSEIGMALREGRDAVAAQALQHWHRVFGDRLCLELTRCGRAGEDAWVAGAVELAQQFQIPAIASNDVRFLAASDFEAHEARVCISSGRVLADPKRPRDYSEQQYLKSAEEMAELFADLPEALENSVRLAERCNLELRLGEYFLPQFPVPEGETLDSHLRHESERGLQARLEQNPLAGDFTREDYDRRLDRELGVIIQMGFPGYFLIVADFIRWAKEHQIPVGPGRGSGAGSLVAWSLGITDLDPLAYDLLFERFLNPERVSMPDFDIDFCMDRRDEVIDYVAEAYGRDKVGQIITYGTMAAKAVVRDTGRVLGMPYPVVDGIAKLVPNVLGISLDDALGRSEKAAKDNELASSELIQRYQSEDEVRELIDLALKLENLTRNAGKHAGGVVIGPSPLTDFSPLYAEEGSSGMVTQFDKNDVESVGLVKFDFLGLRTLTIIDWAVKAIDRRRKVAGEEPLDVIQLPLDDPDTYALLSRGETTAVFQFESRGMKDYIRKLQPTVFEDLIALAALYRPGPLNSGMVDDFIDRRHGRAEVSYPHPLLEPILKPTYGVIVYQEQVMQIAQVMGGYSLGGADLLRRAMGKKKPEEMAKERVKFEAGAEQNNIDPKLASSIFDLMEKFAEYGFNKSHSAAYALVAYQTAWLKAHYPAEFMAAVMSSDMDSTEKVVNFIEEARRGGIEVLPPDINSSGWMFEALPDGRIRYGLGAIKGVGHGAITSIVEQREAAGAYANLYDLCRRNDDGKLNRRVIEAMILSGALDGLGANRASLTAQLPDVLRATEQARRERDAGQSSLFGGGEAVESTPPLELIEVPEWPVKQRLLGERDTLGHFLSGHPMDAIRDLLGSLVSADLGNLDSIPMTERPRGPEANATVAGLVGGVRRRGDSQLFAQIEDGRGRIEAAFFSDAARDYGNLLSRDRVVVLEGRLSTDAFNGGYNLRVRQAWDFEDLLGDRARRLLVELDDREGGRLAAFRELLGQYQPGDTAIALQLTIPGGQGVLHWNGQHGVRACPELIDALRPLPGVGTVKLDLRPAEDSIN